MSDLKPCPFCGEQMFRIFAFWAKEKSKWMPTLAPKEDGGFQLEWHRNGWDIEIEFDKAGCITGVSVDR
jgi:hypothetical protein